MAFYDSASQADYNIVSNSTEEGFKAEFSHSSLLDVNIPETVVYSGTTYTVVGISANAFKDATLNIKNLKLPQSIEYIGTRAFYNTKFQLSGNYTLSLPSSLVKLGDECFMNAWVNGSGSLTIGMSKLVKEIPYRCFFQTDVAGVSLGSETEKIGEYAFASFKGYCSGGSNIRSIGASAFYNTTAQTDFAFGQLLSAIGNYAFSNSALREVVIEKAVEIGAGAFSDCGQLKEVLLPEGLSAIPNECFNNCTALTKINVPSSIEAIGNKAFYGCYSLQNIDLPTNLTTLGNEAFKNCENIVNLEIPENLMELGNSVFMNTGIEKIDLNNVISVGASAFRNCKNLTDIDFGHVVSISQSAFANCAKVFNLYLPETLQTIGETAFEGVDVQELYLFPTISSVKYSSFSTFSANSTVYIFSEYPINGLSVIASKIKNSNVYIPAGVENRYRTDADWNQIVEYKFLPAWTVKPASFEYGEPIKLDLIRLSPTHADYLLREEDFWGQPSIKTDYMNWKNAGDYRVELEWGDTGTHHKFVMLVGSVINIFAVDQQIIWHQDFQNIKVGDTVTLNATTSSGLELSWSIDNDDMAEITVKDGAHSISFHKAGELVLTARQAGDLNHNPIEAHKHIKVADLSGLIDIEADDNLFSINGNRLTFLNTDIAQHIRIYSTNGILLYKGNEPDHTLDNGVYIIVIDSKAYKIKI